MSIQTLNDLGITNVSEEQLTEALQSLPGGKGKRIWIVSDDLLRMRSVVTYFIEKCLTLGFAGSQGGFRYVVIENEPLYEYPIAYPGLSLAKATPGTDSLSQINPLLRMDPFMVFIERLSPSSLPSHQELASLKAHTDRIVDSGTSLVFGVSLIQYLEIKNTFLEDLTLK